MTERAPPHARRAFAAIYGSVFVFMAAEGALHVLVPPYLALEYGLGPAVIGLVVGVFAFASLAARLPVGAVYTVDRAKRLLLLGGALSVVAFALLPLAPNTAALAALMALDGLGWSIATTVQLAVVVAGRRPGTSSAAAMGWYAGFTGLGNATAGVAAGVLADAIGLRPAFVLLAALLGVGTLMIMRATPRNGGTLAERRTEPPLRRALAAFRAMPAIVWLGVLVMFYINFVNGVVGTFQPVLALAAGLTLTQIGVLASCRGWASSISRLSSGAIFARVPARGLTAPLVLLSTLAVFLIPAVRASFVLQIPLFLAIGLSRGLLRVTASADAFDGVGDDERLHGLTAAVLHAGLDAGKVAGPVLGGVVAEVVGIATMFQVLPVLVVAMYAALAVGVRRGPLAAEARIS